MISLRQINNQHVEPIAIPSNLDHRIVRGHELSPEIFSNFYMVAKKKCGKTSCVFKIVRTCADRHTKIIIFASTVYKDEAYIQMRKYFKKKGNPIEIYTSIFDNGEDQLALLVEKLSKEAEEKELEEQELEENEENNQINNVQQIDKCDLILQRLNNLHLLSSNIQPSIPEKDKDNDKNKEKKKKDKKTKFRTQDLIIILDDISSELRSQSLLSLLKSNRHFLCKVLVSSQYLNDLKPESRRQIDYWLIFKGNDSKLKEIYRDCDTSISFPLFCKIYEIATQKPHSFLYIDTRNDTFRSNFNKLIVIDSNEHNNPLIQN